MNNYWLVKSEPEEYSFDNLLEDKTVDWTGVRNYQARNYLKNMKLGDKVLFYHSYKEKRIVGIASVVREYFPDPFPEGKQWVAVKLKAELKMTKAIELDEIKNNITLRNLLLLKQPRLSVMPVSKNEFDCILLLAKS